MDTTQNSSQLPSTDTSTTRHAVAVDVVLFVIDQGTLKVLLIRRNQAPYAGEWAIPGGVVKPQESLDTAALRVLQEETHIGHIYLEQLYSFGEPNRDPRDRVISVAYYALVSLEQPELRAQNQNGAVWSSVNTLPNLAFDHNRIVHYALERLRNKINYTTLGFQLLPKVFTLTELQGSYEIILGRPLDKRNFRRKMLQLGILKSTRQFKTSGRQRPARLYTFAQPTVIRLQEKGIIVPFAAS